MRIGLEATAACAAQEMGSARYARSLINALIAGAGADDRFTLFYRLSRWKQRRHRHLPAGVPARWYQEGLWPPWPGVDLVHGTEVRVPAWRGVVRVATVHDVFHCFPFAQSWSSPAFGERARGAYRDMARAAHVIIAVSAVTRCDFLDHHDFPPERVVVVPEGVSPRFRPHTDAEVAPIRQRLGLPEEYLLFVGALAIRKNVPNLIAGYARSPLYGRMPLVLAGVPSDDETAIATALAQHAPGKQVLRLDFVDDADLPALYAGAAAFCYPTWYEGFGLPVLEAMASGTPVVAGDRGAATEVGGGHAVAVDPALPEDIARGLAAAVALSPAAREAARKHAAAFTWAVCAERTRKAYDLALAAAKR